VDENETPQETLQHYFDDLFTGADGVLEPAQPVPIPEPKKRPKPRLVKPKAAKPRAVPAFAEPGVQSEQKVKLERLLKTASVTARNTESPVKPAPVPAPAPEIVVEAKPIPVAEPLSTPEMEVEAETLVAEQIEGLEWAANGRPPWAQDAFDVLLFKVSGLTLAVPLVSLGQIQPLTEDLTPIFGQADWFMGLQPTSLGKIRTINTALFVMPERYDPAFLASAKLVISINGLPWGLAVDSVNQPITLDPNAVNWRSNRSKRPWLAGTVKEQMCALIDIPMMGKLLLESDANTNRN